MRYIQLIELESMEFTSCKIQGLSSDEISRIENVVKNLKISSNATQEAFYEVGIQGIKMMNILAGTDFGYRLSSQSMVIEKSNIGSRTIQTQKTVWTLYRDL